MKQRWASKKSKYSNAPANDAGTNGSHDQKKNQEYAQNAKAHTGTNLRKKIDRNNGICWFFC